MLRKKTKHERLRVGQTRSKLEGAFEHESFRVKTTTNPTLPPSDGGDERAWKGVGKLHSVKDLHRVHEKWKSTSRHPGSGADNQPKLKPLKF